MERAIKVKFRCVIQILLLLLVLITPTFAFSLDTQDKIYNLELTIHCPKRSIEQGDEIPIVFTITNKDSSPYRLTDRSGDRSGRMEEYKLITKDENGEIVPDPREEYRSGRGGGLTGGADPLGTGESFSKTITLNLWSLIKKPGRYSIVGTYEYGIKDPNTKKYLKDVPVESEPIKIIVKPRSDRQMEKYINSLIEKLNSLDVPSDSKITQIENRHYQKLEGDPNHFHSDPPELSNWKPGQLRRAWEEREEIIDKLAYTCDSRIVPALIESMYKNGSNNEIASIRFAFLLYLPKDVKTRNLLLKAAKKRGLANGMTGALERFGCSEKQFKEIIAVSLVSEDLEILNESIVAAQKHPHDDHMAKLIEIALDPNRPQPYRTWYAIERGHAIYAIAYNRTDEGVKALKILLKDSEKSIRRDAEYAIQHIYEYHPAFYKYADDEYTAQLVSQLTDHDTMDTMDRMDMMHWIVAIREIARTRSQEGIEAVKALLEDPDKDIPIAQTDKGVKALKSLLKNPNKVIRREAARLIQYSYKYDHGRPLRNDDFPQFNLDAKTRKERVLKALRNN